MATYTPNIDLKKPAQSDKIRIADLNGNADNIDAALGADFGVSNKPSVDDAVNSLGAGLAIISNGDIHAAITAGQYVYVRGHGTLTEGLYVATANVSQNGALTGSNVDAVSGGGLNVLNSNLKQEVLQTVNDEYNYLKVAHVGNLYIVQYTRKTEVANATEAYAIAPEYAPDSQAAAWTFYKQTSGYALCQGLLKTDGKIILLASTYNENLAGSYMWIYVKS